MTAGDQKRVTKSKPRCKNCSDETTFPSNCDTGRMLNQFCVLCQRFWESSGGGRRRTGAGTPTLTEEAKERLGRWRLSPTSGMPIVGKDRAGTPRPPDATSDQSAG